MTIIDVHTHIFTDSLISALDDVGMAARIGFDRRSDGQVMLTFDGKPRLGPIPEGIRDIDVRLRDMDRQGVEMHVLAPHQCCSATTSPATSHSRSPVGATTGSSTSQAASRPVQRIRPAADAGCRAVSRRTRAGGGRPAGARCADRLPRQRHQPRRSDVRAAVARPRAPRPSSARPPVRAGRPRTSGCHYLINLIGNPLDSTIAIASLIFGGVLEGTRKLGSASCTAVGSRRTRSGASTTVGAVGKKVGRPIACHPSSSRRCTSTL